VIVRGQIPIGHAPLVRVADWADPDFLLRGFLIEELKNAGVEVQASLFAPPAKDLLPLKEWYATAPRVAVWKSAPFSENAQLILKVSHNLHASTLPLLIAAKHGERTLAAGLKHEAEFLKRAGVDVSTISFGGGAGGSRADYTTPTATVQLLRYMTTRPDFEAYNAALPVLGVDGTLATVVDESSPARGQVRAKTGTLYFENTLADRWLLTSKALAGYIDAASGRKVVFAVFVNGTHLDTSDQTKREGRTLGRIAETIQQGL
jgi:serine-type D-Ala-D-Ala carboxypeptidase/endopeptidase (penicillin-binding protein 4)